MKLCNPIHFGLLSLGILFSVSCNETASEPAEETIIAPDPVVLELNRRVDSLINVMKMEKHSQTTVINKDGTYSDWALVAGYYKIEHQIPEITQEVVDSGAVLVFTKRNAGWIPLPFNNQLGGSHSEFWYGYDSGKLKLIYEERNDQPGDVYLPEPDVKIVIIPHSIK